MDECCEKFGYTTLQEVLEAYDAAKLTQSTGVTASPASYKDLDFYLQIDSPNSGTVYKFYYSSEKKSNPPHNGRYIPKGTTIIKYTTTEAPPPFHSIEVTAE